MNTAELTVRIQSDLQPKWEQAVSRNNIPLAASILVQSGLIDEAIEFCSVNNELQEALDIAIHNKKIDIAETLCKMLKNQQKYVDICLLKGDYEKATDTLIQLQNFEQAAKICFNQKQYSRAGSLYEKANQFMNAVMCYQKANDIPKQLEMQIKAFENDLAMANGDIQLASVSRTMAIFAAKSYLEKEETQQRGLEVLEEANALESVAQEFYNDGKFELAAVCFEKAQKFPEAIDAFLLAKKSNDAIRICLELKDDALEIDTLKRAGSFFMLGQKYANLKQYENAISALKKVDTDDDNYLNALEVQGDIYCKLKNYSDAVMFYETLCLKNLSNDRICRVAYKAGYCYDAMKDYKNAELNYQKVFDINPEFHDISSSLSIIKRKRRHSSDSQTRSSNPQRTSRERISASAFLKQHNPSSDQRNAVVIGKTAVPVDNGERYKIIEEVAHGGMGVVYKACDTILLRTVALKILSQKLKDNKVALEYFMREARASAQLQHPNIVTVYDIGSLSDGNIYMAMEYVEGKNLKQIVQQTGAFPTKFLVQIILHACRGLQYAHDNGIIHRDIKSSNMMLAKRDKTLKILDLGLAKIITEHDKNSTQAIGTPYYMSPEQVLGNAIDARSDIYSLGVTLYELATGTLPFTKGDLPYKHVHEQPPLPSSFNPQIHPQIEELILKMMQKSPDDRFSSCNEIISFIKNVKFNQDISEIND
ncbi:MAG: protein kinase [Proteobacteria bacterium]|nr:protein kinase [Pseudomonadota bacterium]